MTGPGDRDAGAPPAPGALFPAPAVAVDHVEAVPRRVRARLEGHVVLDTDRALYVWEWPFYPQFHIPAADVDPAVLVDEEHVSTGRRGRYRRVGLRVGAVERPGCGRHYVEPARPGIVDTIRFDWSALDEWFEEDEQVFVHPRSPYVRVDALRSSRMVRVELDGVVLAASSSPVLLFETGLPTRYYFDPTSVDMTRLEPSDTVTPCPYKGRTSQYWSVRTSKGLSADLAWRYDYPAPSVSRIAGLIAFYDESVDVSLDGVAQPRPVTHFA